MNIIFNTRKLTSPASTLYSQALSGLEGIHYCDWGTYSKYDVALFMSYRRDLEDVVIAKRQNPNLKIGIIDPRGSLEPETVECVDFMVLDSLEMRDFFIQYHRPIFTYYDYLKLKIIERKHVQKETAIIGYHGGKGHLDEDMYPRITKAIEMLGKKYSIEFWAMYNIEEGGNWVTGVPANVPVKHIQWSEENYYKYLAQVDIGIVPGLRPIKNILKLKRKSVMFKTHLHNFADEYLIKFKLANAGRIIVFSLLGIPVVADMYPSAMQFIRDGENGFIAYSTWGWYYALEKLVQSADLRQELTERMRQSILPVVDCNLQNKALEAFLHTILQAKSSTVFDK